MRRYLGTFTNTASAFAAQAITAGLPAILLFFDAMPKASNLKTMRLPWFDGKQITPGLVANLISSAQNELIDAAAYADMASGEIMVT